MENLNLTQKEIDFVTDAFLEHGKLIKQVARKYAKNGINASDVESYLNERFSKIVLSYDPSKSNNLGGYINYWLNMRAKNYLKSAEHGENTISTPFSAFDGDDGEEKPNFEETHLTDGYTVEDDVIRTDYVGETINLLFEKATDKQRKIMNAILNAEGKANYTAIGKAVGMHHVTVKRELVKLSKLADFDLTVF